MTVTAAASLECEQCSDNGTTCAGEMETCLFNENTCAIHLFEDSRVPPMDNKANGRQCPSCYSWSEGCSIKMVNCTGKDTHCFEVSSQTHSGGIFIDSTIKGCTSKSVCTSLKKGKSPIVAGLDYIKTAECTPDVSRGSPCNGPLLLIVPGILLKILLLFRARNVMHRRKRFREFSIAITMQFLLMLFLFSVLLETDGATTQSEIKGCETLEVCTLPALELNMGGGKIYRAGVVCCTGSNCKQVSPELPETDSTANGIQCPACYSSSGTCASEMVNCTGAEKHCFDVNTVQMSDGNQIEYILRGCTTESVCLTIKSGRSPIVGGDRVKKASCRPDVSQGAPPSGLLLPAFSGLLLVKVLL
ncbi:uncharacterized protein LOC123026052 [Varanus komodoensis]|uniref:uncharacterized protein LOC123026052 n=1 Tax=Varanus komodoensis TaxID=61221 RepID=UPI001CF7D75B|nr:uncharacterized protein LOC123026052 [Varanus komodoensis]